MRSQPRGIALVITLLMLSVITFLAIAFLVLTRGHRDSVTVVTDANTAKSMAEIAAARAKSQIMARIMAHKDLYNFEYAVSHNGINSGGFVTGQAKVGNVNYDYHSDGSPMGPNYNPVDWAQNIANLFLDPRAPVFIRTANGTDFRFWVDLNRNGRFETNGNLPMIDDSGRPVVDQSTGNTNFAFNFGEPEWIGVLQYPEFAHSATNRFIGRYAFLIQPIGKMLDWNFIHNFSKATVGGVGPAMVPPSPNGTGYDGFLRDQGVGSWELNLAGYFWGLSPSNYVYRAPFQYTYLAGATGPNTGTAFDDAYSFLRFRFAGNYRTALPGFGQPPYPLPLISNFNVNLAPNYLVDGIDEYGTEAFLPAASYPQGLQVGWPGNYATNHIYNLQDTFDVTKNSPAFGLRVFNSGLVSNSNDRYLFNRMISTIGSGSQPELQTYVYDNVTNLFPGLAPTLLRTKLNINYDNSNQMAYNLNASPTTLVPWRDEANGSITFFTNAADLLLRSQDFRITNYLQSNYVGILPTNIVYTHFGVSGIPIYDSSNPSIKYNEHIHRMLQLAANIYDATRTNTAYFPGGVLPEPSVFRPIFFATNYGPTNRVYIVGYSSVTGTLGTTLAGNNIPPLANGYPFVDPSNIQAIEANPTTINVWGVPWVIGAVKGLPEFDRFVGDTSWLVTRKLLFARKNPVVVNGQSFGDPSQHPAYTNQFLIMSVTNVFGVDAWNSYAANIVNQNLTVVASTLVTVFITNNSTVNPGSFTTSYILGTNFTTNRWRGYGSRANPTMADGMLGFLQTNVPTLQSAYFSETAHRFISVFYSPTNGNGTGYGGFLPADLVQKSWPIYDWTLAVTNRVFYTLLDANGRVLDFVNLGPFGTNYVLTNLIYSTTSLPALAGGSANSSTLTSYWNPAPNQTTVISTGVMNQISNGINNDTYFSSELNGTTASLPSVKSGALGVNSNLYFSCTNENPPATFPYPTTTQPYHQTLLCNDPLVHYTVADLTNPQTENSEILQNNDRYEPWPTLSSAGSYRANMNLKDPLITNSDAWIFPTNLFPSIGWLGRVHRGTPWQTVFLKAAPDVAANGVSLNSNTWSGWVSTLDTFPTGDYALLDLFTAAPNDNASRGLLSVNQTNAAPWYAVFSGVALETNILNTNYFAVSGPTPGPATVIDPSAVSNLVAGYNVVLNGQTNYVPGISATRALQPDGVFQHIGNIFATPALSVYSPILPAPAGNFRDEEVEGIPQQVAGLLKLGEPQFVIYGWGQSLKPKDIYFGGPPNFNLCTNYQITGEFFTRTVCHVVGDPNASNLKLEVDSFNILPAD